MRIVAIGHNGGEDPEKRMRVVYFVGLDVGRPTANLQSGCLSPSIQKPNSQLI